MVKSFDMNKQISQTLKIFSFHDPFKHFEFWGNLVCMMTRYLAALRAERVSRSCAQLSVRLSDECCCGSVSESVKAAYSIEWNAMQHSIKWCEGVQRGGVGSWILWPSYIFKLSSKGDVIAWSRPSFFLSLILKLLVSFKVSPLSSFTGVFDLFSFVSNTSQFIFLSARYCSFFPTCFYRSNMNWKTIRTSFV